MREKYLNMSGFELEKLTAMDMLNITYEHNRKQAILANLNNSDMSEQKRIRGVGLIKDSSSSSSSSARNEARFNIFEEKEKYFKNIFGD